jgi:hypothetical protein
MKHLLPILLLCSTISVSAQKNTVITRSGNVINNSQPLSNKLVDYASVGTNTKPSAKPKPSISGINTLFYESFENIYGTISASGPPYFFPNTWFRRNVDNRIPNASTAYINDAWIRRDDFGLNTLDSVAFSNSYYAPTGQADDWMWTPLISGITAHTTLKWSARAYDPAYRDGYEVRIMRASQGPPTGGTGVMGNQVTNSVQVFSVAAEEATWVEHTVDLGAFANDAVYIGFRNNSNDKFLLVIDDVLVENDFPYDLSTFRVKNVHEYTVIPLSETRPLSFESTIVNSGFEQANQVRMRVNIKKDAERFANISTVPTTSDFIPAGLTKVFTNLNAYTPRSIGTYSFTYYQTFDNEDTNPGNDSLDVLPLKISRNTFSRVAGSAAGAIGIGAGPGKNGLLGTLFTLNTTEKVQGILVKMNPFIGTKVKARIYTTTDGIPDNALSPLWESAEITMAGTESSSFFFSGNNPPVLGPGTYWFGCLEIDSTLSIQQHSEIFKPNTNYVAWATNPSGANVWSPVESFGNSFAKPFAIYPVFECPEALLVSNYISNEDMDKIAAKTIEANKLINNSKVLFEAGKAITLQPGFSMTGNRFSAEIGNGCSNPDF